jgi:hypothetical protein
MRDAASLLDLDCCVRMRIAKDTPTTPLTSLATHNTGNQGPKQERTRIAYRCHSRCPLTPARVVTCHDRGACHWDVSGKRARHFCFSSR